MHLAYSKHSMTLSIFMLYHLQQQYFLHAWCVSLARHFTNRQIGKVMIWNISTRSRFRKESLADCCYIIFLSFVICIQKLLSQDLEGK